VDVMTRSPNHPLHSPNVERPSVRGRSTGEPLAESTDTVGANRTCKGP
jgi:hypothetical protein